MPGMDGQFSRIYVSSGHDMIGSMSADNGAVSEDWELPVYRDLTLDTEWILLRSGPSISLLLRAKGPGNEATIGCKQRRRLENYSLEKTLKKFS